MLEFGVKASVEITKSIVDASENNAEYRLEGEIVEYASFDSSKFKQQSNNNYGCGASKNYSPISKKAKSTFMLNSLSYIDGESASVLASMHIFSDVDGWRYLTGKNL